MQKKWSKTVICGLSSGQTNLHPPIWGHGRQLDERHRNPNINIREIIWLGNQIKKTVISSDAFPQPNAMHVEAVIKTIKGQLTKLNRTPATCATQCK